MVKIYTKINSSNVILARIDMLSKLPKYLQTNINLDRMNFPPVNKRYLHCIKSLYLIYKGEVQQYRRTGN